MLPDVVDFFLEREAVQGRERKAQKQTDPSVQQGKSLAESFLDLLACSLHRGRIGYAPMSGHRLARPHRTHFVRGVVTDSEYEI